jgi:hypothetical protein
VAISPDALSLEKKAAKKLRKKARLLVPVGY